MADVRVVEVRIWGQSVGAVAPLKGKPGFYEFQYAPAFENSGLELSPLLMKLDAQKRFSFPGLAQDTFHGLPGLLADALPDKFGNALIDEYLTRHGTQAEEITTLQRLVYVGRRAMGALEPGDAWRRQNNDGVAQRSGVNDEVVVVALAEAQWRGKIPSIGPLLRPPHDLHKQSRDYAQRE